MDGLSSLQGFPDGSVVKNPPANAADIEEKHRAVGEAGAVGRRGPPCRRLRRITSEEKHRAVGEAGALGRGGPPCRRLISLAVH